MNYKKLLGAASAVLMIVVVITLALTSGAWGQTKYKTLHTFHGKDGTGPEAGLIFDAAGNLYGTTNGGGAYKEGTVFELTPTSNGGWAETVLYSFCAQSKCTDGKNPFASVIFDAAGNLYGTASGGQNGKYCYDGCGVVFELTPTTSGEWTESVLYSFTGGPDGAGPVAGLVVDTAGNLFGTTWQGGHITSFCYDGCGVVFELTPGSKGWTESVPHTFMDKWDGSNSTAALVLDSTGNLYGVAWNGGRYEDGNVFKLTPNSDGSWTEKVLHQFRGKDGAEPQGRLIFDTAGNLYGSTIVSEAYGSVFQLVPNSNGTWTRHILHQFKGGKDGATPYAGLTFDSAGSLYGDTNSGGDHGYGVVFRLTPTSTGGWSYRVLHAFNSTSGANPRGDLVVDGAGNLYGTTYAGGKGHGTVFEITP
ncbi:MAG: choice-of-anchor tandem repeat GloVer-containing protein [Terriglobales bacterium]